ncbi:hypothetical protein N8T08_007825 [Aspergillus melleus]|uniref:Uncharacterized protein n=1 Tax=Aspergillus melleus TaxID=138277 RepID=A0ACC3AX03_9EURO|nr:hypothetical protein N8T08_007825 [Aspergillus melleus]
MPTSPYHEDPSRLDRFDSSVAHAQEHPSADSHDSEGDGYGDSLLGGDTKTLSTYITDYRYEFGRRYHSYHDGAYWGPNDEIANEFQDLAHHMSWSFYLGYYYGLLILASDMADEYPSAIVTGVDLSPIQPTFVPPNCVFEIDDITLPWTYASNQFDFIHVREMFGCIPDWDEFFRQCWRCLKPGGFIEVVEHAVQPTSDDGSMGPDHFYHLWGKTVVQSGEKFGKSFTIWEESSARLKNAGFVGVVETGYKWPMNGWSTNKKLHDLGRWNQLRLHGGIEGFMLRLLTSTLQWSFEQAQVFLAQMRSSLRDYKTHAYLPGTAVYAQKPKTSTLH